MFLNRQLLLPQTIPVLNILAGAGTASSLLLTEIAEQEKGALL